MATDPYTTLGVAKSASQDDIKQAYRKLAKSLHPDLNPGRDDIEAKFKTVTAAYELLSDPDKRGRFDRGEIDADGNELRANPFGRGFGGAGRGAGTGGRARRGAGHWSFHSDDDHEGLRDLFDDLFGGDPGNRGYKAGPTRATKSSGGDIRYRLKVAFVDAALGVKKRVTMPDGRSLDINVPPGVNDGQVLRLKGQGKPATGRNGQAGNALVELEILPHAHLKRDGRDIHLKLPITLSEAALGGKVTVPTLDGSVSLTVPAGSNTGTVLRVKGKGIPSPGTKDDDGKPARGDQYVTLWVMLPKEIDPALRDFLEEWSETRSYNPRAGMAGT